MLFARVSVCKSVLLAQAKMGLHPGRCLLCCFWNSQAMLRNKLLPKGRTATVSIYAIHPQVVANAVREKRLRPASGHLLHHNAWLHIAKKTRENCSWAGTRLRHEVRESKVVVVWRRLGGGGSYSFGFGRWFSRIFRFSGEVCNF